MSRRRMMLGNGELLPAEYQQVEWIESDGNQLISTGIKPQTKQNIYNYKMVGEVSIPVINSAVSILMCYASDSGHWIGNVNAGANIGIGNAFIFNGINISQKNTISLYWNSDYGYGEWNGNTVSRQMSNASYTASSFCFFGDAGKEFLAKCRFYRAKLLYQNDSVFDGIPCYRKLDGVIGMYDIVTNTFFTNAGTGTFTKGADI